MTQKPNKKLSLAALAAGGAILTTSFVGIAPAYAAPVTPEVTNAVVDTTGDVGQDGVLRTTETVALNLDFSIPDSANAGDTFTVKLEHFAPKFNGELEITNDNGDVIGTAVQAPGQGIIVTLSDQVDILQGVTGSVGIPIIGVGYDVNAGETFPVTYAINDGAFVDTGTEFTYPELSPYSTGGILYATANAEREGLINLSPAGSAAQSEQVRDVTMVFKPASENWSFNTDATPQVYSALIDQDQSLDEIPGDGTAWETRFEGEVTIDSVTADEVVVTMHDVPAGYAARLQLANSMTTGFLDGNNYELETTVTSPGSVNSGSTNISTVSPSTVSGIAEGTVITPGISIESYLNDVDADTPEEAVTTELGFGEEFSGTVRLDITNTGNVPLIDPVITLPDGTERVLEGVTIPVEGTHTETLENQSYPTGETAQDWGVTANGVSDTDPINANITVAEAADPAANPDTGETEAGTPVTVTPLDNDELTQEGATWEKIELLDPEGNPVTELVVDEGTFVVNDDNTVTFTPADDFSGVVPDAPYRATDSNGKTADSTITITVNEAATPEAPGANPDTATTEKDTPVTLNPLENDELPEDREWTSVDLLDSEGNPVKELETDEGTFVVNEDNAVTFTPAEGFTGDTPEVPYRATDSEGGTADSTIKVTVTETPAEEPTAPVEEPTDGPSDPVNEEPSDPAAPGEDNGQEPKPDAPADEPKPEAPAPADDPANPSINTGGDPTQSKGFLGAMIGGIVAMSGGAVALFRKRLFASNDDS